MKALRSSRRASLLRNPELLAHRLREHAFRRVERSGRREVVCPRPDDGDHFHCVLNAFCRQPHVVRRDETYLREQRTCLVKSEIDTSQGRLVRTLELGEGITGFVAHCE